MALCIFTTTRCVVVTSLSLETTTDPGFVERCDREGVAIEAQRSGVQAAKARPRKLGEAQVPTYLCVSSRVRTLF